MIKNSINKKQRKTAIFNELQVHYLSIPDDKFLTEYMNTQENYKWKKLMLILLSFPYIVLVIVICTHINHLHNFNFSNDSTNFKTASLLMTTILILIFTVITLFMVDVTKNFCKELMHNKFLNEIKSRRQV